VIESTSGAPTFFWHAFAGLGQVFGVRRTAFLLWFVGRAAAGWATWKTARLLGAGRGGAALALALVLASRHLFLASTLAGDPLFKADLDQTSFIWPFALCAVAAWLAGRKLPSAAGLGLLANLNPLVAGLTFGWLCLAELIAQRRPTKDLAAAALVFLAGALPLLLRLLAHPPSGDPALMADCAPLTYLAWRWPAERWLEAACALALTVAALIRHPDAKRLTPLAISALTLWSLQALLGPIFPRLLALQFFRLDVALTWLGAVAAAALLWPRLGRDEPAQALPALAAVWGFACGTASPLLAAWAAALLLFGRTPRTLTLMGTAGAVYGAAALFLPQTWFPLSMPPAAAAGTCLLAILAGVSPRLPAGPGFGRLCGRLGLPAVLVLAFLPMGGAVPIHIRETRTAVADRTPDPFDLWVRDTPKEARFAAHPASSGLRLRSRRPVYAEWSDFAVALWDRREAAAWKGRMEALGLRWADFRERHAAQERAWDRAYLQRLPSPEASDFPVWSAEDSRRLAGIGGSTFLLVPSSLSLAREPAFQDAGLTVYRTP